MDPVKEILIKCTGASALPYTALTPFQGDLKTLPEEDYEEFKAIILEHGFSAPIFVWVNEDQNFILDGHQRLSCIKRMVEQEGYECPDLPVDWIDADDFTQASEKVLSYISQFGDTDEDRLYKFSQERKIDPDKMINRYKFPQVNRTKLLNRFRPVDRRRTGSGRQEAVAEQFIVAIHCQDEIQQQEIYTELVDRGMECKIIT